MAREPIIHLYKRTGPILDNKTELFGVCGIRSRDARKVVTDHSMVTCAICLRLSASDSFQRQTSIGDPILAPDGFRSICPLLDKNKKTVGFIGNRKRSSITIGQLWVLWDVRGGERGRILQDNISTRQEAKDIFEAKYNEGSIARVL